MNNIKLEAAIILDKWYRLSSYSSENIFCITHKDFKSIVGNTIFTDKELIHEINIQGKEFIVRNDINLLDFITFELKQDKELILDIIKINPTNYALIKNDLKDDKEIMLTAIEKQPTMFAYTSAKFKDEEEVVNLAISKAADNFSYISGRLRGSKNFIIEVLKKHPRIITYIDPTLKSDIELLSKFWESIKKNYSNNTTQLLNNSIVLFNNIDSTIKPFFEAVEPSIHNKVLVNEIDAIFNRLILSDELKTELTSPTNKQEKKIKL